MIDLESHSKCKFTTYIIIFVNKFSTYRYDVSRDGQIDQKELANLILAMVNAWFHTHLINKYILFSMILLAKPIVKVKRIQRNVLLKLLPSLMLMVIKNWINTNLLLGMYRLDFLTLILLSLIRCKNDEVIRRILVPAVPNAWVITVKHP
jgi:hypothetical protein